jgi:hypothetical protein
MNKIPILAKKSDKHKDIKNINKLIKNDNNKDKIKKSDKIKYDKIHNAFCHHIMLLKSYRLCKKSRYFKDLKKVITDLYAIIESKLSTINDIKKIFTALYSSRYFNMYYSYYEEEKIKNYNQNKNYIDPNNIDPNNIDPNNIDPNNINNADYDDIDNLVYIEIQKNVSMEIGQIHIELLKKIKNKFNEIPEQIITMIINSHDIKCSENIICDYLREINYRIKTKKVLDIFLNKISCDFDDMIDFDKIKFTDDSINNLLTTYHFKNNYYKNLDKFINKIDNLNKDKFAINLIKLIFSRQYYYSNYCNIHTENLFNWVLQNLDMKYALNILQYIPLLVFSDMNSIGEFYNLFADELSDDENINDENINDDELHEKNQKKINHIINKLSIKISSELTTYYDIIKEKYKDTIKLFLKDFDEIDNLIVKSINHICYFHDENTKNTKNIKRKRSSFRSLKINDDKNDKNINSDTNFDDNTIYYSNIINNINGKQIKQLYNTLRLPVFTLLYNNIVKEKNILNLKNINVFNNTNFLLTFDEKIKLFETIFSGKITNKDLIELIFHNNQIAAYIINNINVSEDMIKTAFKSSNIYFITRLVEQKYNMKTSYLNFILENKNLEQILKIINKYNTLEFDDEYNWILHITYLNNDINIGKCFYNEHNDDMITELNNKITQIKQTKNIMLFDNMNFNDFVEQIHKYINKYKIKLTIYDIMKLKDFNKRLYILNYTKLY